MKENGYEMKRYDYPVKRYCQTMDLKDDPEMIAKYRECHSKAKSWQEIRRGDPFSWYFRNGNIIYAVIDCS